MVFASTESHEITCDQAALAVAEKWDVPPQVMLAITRVETGQFRDDKLRPWPWTINQAGNGQWFATAAEAIAAVEPALQAGATNIDIGCFQLNVHWHSKAFSSLEEMFDPVANAAYAAQFLAELHARKGNWVDAVAAYHSESPERASAYVEKIEAVLADLPPITETPQPSAARQNLFPLLQPGNNGAMASLMPAQQAATPFFSQVP